MNRREFVAEIVAALGGRSTSDETMLLTVGGADYNLVHQWIYRGERRIATIHDFDSMRDEDTSLSTVADDSTPISLSLIDDYTKSIQSIRIIDGSSSYKLTYKTPMWMDRFYPYPPASGSQKPSFYTLKANAIRFNVVPDAAYTLYVDRTTYPAPMSSDTSVSSFGEYIVDHVILEYGTAFGFLHLGEAYKKDFEYHLSMGDRLLREVIGADNYVPDYVMAPLGYSSKSKRLGNSLDAGSFPDGVANPWR